MTNTPMLTEEEAEAMATLHPVTAELVRRFSAALAAKLKRAEDWHGFTDGWARDDWRAQCLVDLERHIQKGDPLDVAAYAAFCWHHGWSTTPAPPTREAMVKRAQGLYAAIASAIKPGEPDRFCLPSGKWVDGEDGVGMVRLINKIADGVKLIWTDGEQPASPAPRLSSRLAEVEAALSEMTAALVWIGLFADMRSRDESKVFARVGRGAMWTIAQKAREALAPLPNPLVLDSVEGGSYSANLPSDANASELPAGWVLVPREPTEAMLQAGMLGLTANGMIQSTKGLYRPSTLDAYRAMLAAAPNPPSSTAGDAAPRAAPQLSEDQVEWVVNDIAELGVKIGNQFFFCYKGRSLVYAHDDDDTESPMHWRPIFKREFGECIHPINREDLRLIGTVSLDDSDDWQPLPKPPASDALLESATKPLADATYDNKEPPP